MYKETISYKDCYIVVLYDAPGYWVPIENGLMFNKTLDEAKAFIDYSLRFNRV